MVEKFETGTFAFILYDTMPSGALVRVAKPHNRLKTFFSIKDLQKSPTSHAHPIQDVKDIVMEIMKTVMITDTV